LEKRGHTVLAPDLLGHGRDRTPLSMVSLSSYVDSVCRIVEALQEHGLQRGL
jgi:esterase/lipase